MSDEVTRIQALQEMLVKLRADLLAAEEEQKTAIRDNIEAIEAKIARLEATGDALQKLIDKEKTLLDVYQKAADKFKGNADIRSFAMQQELKWIQAQIDQQQKLARQMTENNEAAADQVKAHQEKVVELQKEAEQIKVNLEWQDKFTTSVEESVTSAKDLGKSLGGAFKGAFGGKDYAGIMVKMAKALRGGSVSAKAFADNMSTAVVGNFVNTILGMVVALHDAEAQFMKATGASEDFARGVTSTFEQTRQYGVTVKDASAATEALYKSYTDFTFLAEDTRVSLQNTVATLSRLGIAVNDMAKGTQIATKMLGVSAQNAGRVQEEIADYAMAIGVAPAQMAASFASAGGNLAKFGDQGVRVFKDMQRTAKITGMEMDKLFQMTNKFDTFEGAATQAGKLNAALGGNFVNAMDLMMTTDPAERFDMIRSSILDAGLSFDTMSYYQKNFYKDALGLGDVSELALVLSGNQDLLAGSTNKTAAEYTELAERAKTMQSLQDKWNTALVENAPVLETLIGALTSLANNFDKIVLALRILAPLYVANRVATMAYSVVVAANTLLTWAQTKADTAHANASGILTKAIWAKTAALLRNKFAMMGVLSVFLVLGYWFFQHMWGSTFTEALLAMSFALLAVSLMTKKAGKGFAKATPGFLAFGAAAMAIGLAVKLTVDSLTNLTAAFGQIGDAAPYALGAIVVLSAAFIAFGVIMGVLIYTGVLPAAALGMLALGAAALMMGAGIALAATGLSALINSLAALNIDNIANIVALSFALQSLHLALLPFANPILMLAIVNITPILSLVEALRDIADISLDETAKDIRKIVGEIKSLDTERTKAFTAAMSAVTTSIIEVRQAPTAALAAASAAPANTRPGSTTTQIILDSSATRKFFEDVFNEGMAVFVDEAIR